MTFLQRAVSAVVASFMGAMTLAVPVPRAHASSADIASACLPLDDTALVLRAYLRDLVTTTDADRVALRTELGLAPMDSNQVVIETDGHVCGRVADAINEEQDTPQLERNLYVFKLGDVRAAQDPDHLSGEWMPTVIVDAKYKVVGVVLAP